MVDGVFTTVDDERKSVVGRNAAEPKDEVTKVRVAWFVVVETEIYELVEVTL